MICKSCGAVIKNNEEYCRKCGALVIIFKQAENTNLKDICIENNMSGKFQSIVNKITNKESNAHKVENINKNKRNLNNMRDLTKSVKNNLSTNQQLSKLNTLRKDNNGKDWVEWIIDAVEDLFRI